MVDATKPANFFKGQERKLLLLPIGSIEQHGPYLPIDTDLRISQLLADELEKSLLDVDTLLLPAIPFSCSWEHKGLGTIALNVSTVSAILHDIAKSLKVWNVPVLLVLVNWHGGNSMLASLATEITATEALPCAALPTLTQVGKFCKESGITEAEDVHAGAVETSIIQAYWPGLIVASVSQNLRCEPNITPVPVQAVLQSIGSSITQQGIWGAPEDANAAQGKRLIENLVKRMYEQTHALLDLVNEQLAKGMHYERSNTRPDIEH